MELDVLWNLHRSDLAFRFASSRRFETSLFESIEYGEAFTIWNWLSIPQWNVKYDARIEEIKKGPRPLSFYKFFCLLYFAAQDPHPAQFTVHEKSAVYFTCKSNYGASFHFLFR